MESTDKGTLQNFVIRHTARGAMVYTDEAAAYQGIPRHHEAVKHSAPEAVGTVGIVRTTRFTLTGPGGATRGAPEQCQQPERLYGETE